MQTYKQYKESGIDWIGQIPEHWEVKPGFTVLKERKEKNKGMISSNVLSLSYGKIIEKPIEKLTGLVPENFETYQLVYKGDIIFRPTDLQNDKVSLRTGLSKYNGIITSAYINLQPVNSVPRYLHYFLHTTDTNKVIYGLGSGLRQNISFLDFKRFGFIVPPIHEQEAIANFLDEKTAKIDALVQTKEQQIEKLKELRQAKIHQAVTKGLDANAPTKDSGVDWIGEIPAHWELEKFKYLGFIFPGLSGKKGDDFNKENFEGAKEFVPFTTIFNFSQIKDERFQYVKISPNEIQNKVEKNDLLFLMSSETLNDIAKSSVYLLNKSSYLNSFCKGFRITSTKLNSIFTNYLLSSKNYRNYYELCGRGFTRINIKQEYINDTIIILPPIQEQEQIVAYLDEVTGKIDQAIAQKQEQITKLKEYKQSLINDVVTGKVKVC